MSTAPYVAIATVLDRVHQWWDAKREEWAVTKLIVDDVASGWVPEPEMVGLPPTADECPACDGAGRVSNDDTDSMHTPMWRDCPECGGDGVVAA